MNFKQARNHVAQIFRHVLNAVDPERLTANAIALDGDSLVIHGTRHLLHPGGRIVLLGVGKSSVGMARGVESVLGSRLDHGLVVTKRGLASQASSLDRTRVIEASHPVPDQSSVDAGVRLLEEARGLMADDIAIVVVSGGGSALVEAPVEGVSLEDFRITTDLLLRAGSDIWTLNAVRRHLSRIKAGGLARAIAPARVVNLILSDVLGNPLRVIASGLSVDADDDESDRIDWVMRSDVRQKLPGTVRDRLSTSISREGSELNVVQTTVVGDAALAARAASQAAADLGYRPYQVGVRFAGEAREFGRFWSQLALSTAHGDTNFERPCCIIGAGEMTVTVRGNGVGGRNTEMAAAAALEIQGESEIAIASLATDGDDGFSQAAGGVVDGQTVRRLLDQGIDPAELLDQNDTRPFLEAANGLIVTGQSGTNVNDLYLSLISKP